MPDPWTHALPPDTRAVGTGDPANDEDANVDALTAMGAGFNVLNPAYAGGADPTGATDSTTAIQAAITAAKSAGRSVYFPPGTYLISSPLLAGGGGSAAIQLRGDGWNSQIKLANSSNCYIFDFGSGGSPQLTTGLQISDLYLNCNGANQTGASGGIYARGAVWCLFDHIWMDAPREAGIHFYQDGLGGYGHHNTVRACFISCYGGGFTGQYGVWLDHCDENMIVNNTIQDIGNPATQTYPTGIYDVSGLQTIEGNQVVTGTGIYSGGSGGKTRITNNILDGSYSASGQIYAGNNGVIIANNQCYNIGFNQPSSGLADGIFIDNTDHVTCTGNLCTPFTSTVARSGINLSGTVANSLVQSNTVMPIGGGSFTNSIKIGSAPTGTQIGNNIGYNPAGKLTSPPAVPSSTVAGTNNTGTDCVVYITTGSGVTVSAILIGGNAAGPQAIAASTTAPGIFLPAGQTITLAYAGGTPTWTWFGN